MESLKDNTKVKELKKELLKDYQNNLKDRDFQALINKLNIKEDLGYLYNSSLVQVTITQYSSNSFYVFCLLTFGGINYSDKNNSGLSASPVLYLKSTVNITGGTGTSTDPYTLSL